MSLAVAYWIVVLLWAVLGAIVAPRSWPAAGGALLPWLAAVLIGWAEFGAPVHG